MNKVDEAWNVFQRLMRQYPLWPSTFNPCECGRYMARGSGKCWACYKEDLEKLVGKDLTIQAVMALSELREVWGVIRIAVGEKDGDT